MPKEKQRHSYTGRPATLVDHEHNEFKIQPICRRCWHTGPIVSPSELADRFGLPIASPIPAVEARLRCARCGERAGYLSILNPAVSTGCRDF
jgi:hypothetical protein